VRRDKPWRIIIVIDKPDGADVQRSAIRRCQYPINDVSSAKNRLFPPGDFVVDCMLPQSYIENLPPLWIKPVCHEKSSLTLASPVGRGKQIFNDFCFTDFRFFSSGKPHSKLMIVQSRLSPLVFR